MVVCILFCNFVVIFVFSIFECRVALSITLTLSELPVVVCLFRERSPGVVCGSPASPVTFTVALVTASLQNTVPVLIACVSTCGLALWVLLRLQVAALLLAVTV